MGKSKRKSKGAASPSPPAAEPEAADRRAASIVGLGAPCFHGTLAPRPAAAPAETNEARLGLPPEAFLTAELAAGQLVGVALADLPAARGPDALPGLESAAASPARQPAAPGPHSIWQQLTGVPAPTGAADAALPGEHLLLATVWPAKLPRGFAAPSPSLLASLGGAAAHGEGLLLFKVPQAVASQHHITLVPAPGPAGAAGDGAAWLEAVLAEERPRQLLRLAAAWHLAGRRLLHGNPVALPLLGRECLFSVRLQGAGESPWACAEVGRGTAVSVGQPDRGAAGQEQGVPERAAELAAAAAGGDADGPAAVAARRAAEAGCAALAAGGARLLGGLQRQRAALRRLVCLPLQEPGLFRAYGVAPPRGVLLWGPPGSGKTRLAAATAAAAGAHLLVVNGPDLVSAYYGHSEAGLRGVFAAARGLAPAVLLLDEVDALAPARQGGSAASGAPQPASAAGAAGARTVTALLEELGHPGNAGAVVVVAATNRPAALDAALRRPGRFDQEVEVGVPTPGERADILRAHLTRLRHGLTPPETEALAAAAHGFVGADVAALCDEAALAALRRAVAAAGGRAEAGPPDALQVTAADFAAARARVRPSGLREIAVEVPRVRWADVGGLAGVKQRLVEAVQWPRAHAAAMARLGAQAPAGVLLFGPPGCSKTLLARAVASEAGLSFLAVKGPELVSAYVGDTERAVAALFARARAAAPSIILFDELDGLAGRRGGGGGDSGVGGRVLAQLLTEMDGLQARAGVLVLGTTNRPDRLDAALLRPGRFDRLLFVPPPDAEGREAILRVHTRATPLAPDVCLARLAAQLPDYTGADMTALVREAALAALQESLAAEEVAARHFAAALQVVRPSGGLSAEEQALYESFGRGHGV